MSTIIIISPPPPPPPPDKRAEPAVYYAQADGIHTFPPGALLKCDADREARANRTTAYNTALRALNDAFNDGAEIRVIDA